MFGILNIGDYLSYGFSWCVACPTLSLFSCLSPDAGNQPEPSGDAGSGLGVEEAPLVDPAGRPSDLQSALDDLSTARLMARIRCVSLAQTGSQPEKC